MGFNFGLGYALMPFGLLMMVGFWGLVIFGIVYFVREFSAQGKHRQRSAIDILKERYAKGDIKREEFERMKKDIINR